MLLSGVVASVVLAASKPNIVMILTDDQDTRMGTNPSAYTDIGSMESQPKLRKLMMEGGVRMENFFVNTPICCPSRTEYFTGRYYHNVRGTNGEGCMHVNTTDVHTPDTGLFGLLTEAGYETGVFGKTTNDQQNQLNGLYHSKTVTYIDSPLDFNNYNCDTYYRYNSSTGLQYIEKLNKTSPVFGTTYQTAQLSNRTALWLDTILNVPVGERKPFFAYVGPHAPHFPSEPAPWHVHLYNNYTAPVTPNYNISSPNKTRHIMQNAPLNDLAKCWEDQYFRDRWRTLASVDDLVQIIHDKVEEYDLLGNTFFIYSSDHGFKLGQWRVGVSKMHPYETDVRVPFLISGPGIPTGKVVSDVAGNVDILPTILDIAGVPIPDFVDGRSFAGALLPNHKRQQRTIWLSEYESTNELLAMNFASIWAESSSVCPGPIPKGPNNPSTCVEGTEVGQGNCYLVDSTESNTWRALRVINDTHNLQYIEYDHTWKWNQSTIQYRELYDVEADPYQIHNIYESSDQGIKSSLQQQLSDYYKCSGLSCP
eukprot:TRINITY_DN1242_c1_g1_i1.p1 TRINITY_DN1242_c1_g1~~TRINITY_DN1242_c1_g1_i1.p1  ORF type:complete len:536 (+),score=103.61 TRINITY_DN1242_c1_g1_i1:44-1651(+)